MTRYRCPDCGRSWLDPRGYAAHLDRTGCIAERPIVEGR